MAIKRSVAKFAVVDCGCGAHMIDLYDVVWDSCGIYTCNSCLRPLICRGDDGEFYYVGGPVVRR